MLKIGGKVKKLRAKKKWSQVRLAKEAKLHRLTVIRIEGNRLKDPPISTVLSLAKALGVPITKLL